MYACVYGQANLIESRWNKVCAFNKLHWRSCHQYFGLRCWFFLGFPLKMLIIRLVLIYFRILAWHWLQNKKNAINMRHWTWREIVFGTCAQTFLETHPPGVEGFRILANWLQSGSDINMARLSPKTLIKAFEFEGKFAKDDRKIEKTMECDLLIIASTREHTPTRPPPCSASY